MKKILALLLTLFILLTFGVGTAAAKPANVKLNGQGLKKQVKFSDLQGHWAQQVIEKMQTKGIAGGYDDGAFRPNNLCTQAEATTLIDRALSKKFNIQALNGDLTDGNNGLNIDINLSPAQDISFTRPLTITGTATGPGADNVAWLVEIKDGGVIASFTLANGPEFACDYTPVENLPVVGDYSVRVVATPEAGAPVEKVIPFNIYNYPLKITDLTVADNGATHTLSAIVTNLENSSQPVVGIGQITGPDGSVVFLEPADQITIAALGSQTIVFTFNTPQAAGTYKAEMFIWLFNDGIRTVGTPKDTTFVI